jgi:pimeloyl-ACP methyl ester carboxylesterase
VLLLHGGQDRAVPFGHGQWLASRIPGVEAWFLDAGLSMCAFHIVTPFLFALISYYVLY